MELEIWKDVVGYEGRYQVSQLGNVRRLACVFTRKDGVVINLPPKNMKTSFTSRGYKQISLSQSNVVAKKAVHKLVVEAFIGKIPKGKEINHIDRVRHNNRLDNLEVITHLENMKDYSGYDESKQRLLRSRELKFVGQYDINGNLVAKHKSRKEASKATGIDNSYIGKAIKGIKAQAGGYIWRDVY